jgi:hypothetical protein
MIPWPDRTACRPRIAALLFVVGALTGVASAGSGTAADPLRDEDVVRAWVAGKPTAELVDWIRGSEVAFDLSDEMVSELRQAGLPESVLQAMLATQAPSDATQDPPLAVEPDGVPTLTVRLNPDWQPTEKEPRPVLRLPATIHPQARESLGLREDAVSFTDLAVFLICRSGSHVPDHWRMHSPLGRDFRSAPRHKMLAFAPGAEVMEAGDAERLLSRPGLVPGKRDPADQRILELELPPELAAGGDRFRLLGRRGARKRRPRAARRVGRPA